MVSKDLLLWAKDFSAQALPRSSGSHEGAGPGQLTHSGHRDFHTLGHPGQSRSWDRAWGALGMGWASVIVWGILCSFWVYSSLSFPCYSYVLRRSRILIGIFWEIYHSASPQMQRWFEGFSAPNFTQTDVNQNLCFAPTPEQSHSPQLLGWDLLMAGAVHISHQK